VKRAAILLVAACGGSSATTVDAALDAATGERTLETCETSIDASVPAPYASMFTCVTATATATDLVITTRALPPHRTYYYGAASPNYEPWDDRGGQYHANPNSLAEDPTTFTIPLAPVSRGLTISSAMVDGIVNTSGSEYRGGPVGVALDSVLLFDALAAPGDDIAQEQYTFDEWNAHPAPGGDYHYHEGSPGPLAAIAGSNVEAYGILCDGTLVLGCTELDGSAPDQTDLDAQNGHTHDVTGFGGTLAARYHVHLCPSWPDHPRPYTPEIQFYSTCTVQ
jgi:hypothetical protein